MRFFVDLPLAVGQCLALPENVAHHWLRVMRARPGEQAWLFNGQGGEYQAQLVAITGKTGQVEIQAFNPADRCLPVAVTLGQVMSKGDRLDYAIQKSTEMGVHAIQLLTSERCEMRLKYERDQKKLQHWQGVAIAACEQCGLNRVPRILPPMPLAQWLPAVEADLRFVMTLVSETPVSNGQSVSPLPASLPETVALLVGPEGGLTAAEVRLALAHGFRPWQLGSRTLRTETAPVAALAILGWHAGVAEG